MKKLLSLYFLLTVSLGLFAQVNYTSAMPPEENHDEPAASQSEAVYAGSIDTGNCHDQELFGKDTAAGCVHITVYRQKGKNLLTVNGDDSNSSYQLPDGLYVKNRRQLTIHR